MKLDDIAKMAIDEVSEELRKIDAMSLDVSTKDKLLDDTEEKKSCFNISEKDIHKSNLDEIKTQPEVLKSQDLNDKEDSAIDLQFNHSEEIFLKNLKERVEVLFQGLNEIPKNELENRLELTLKFLEFLLANVENRLENIKK